MRFTSALCLLVASTFTHAEPVIQPRVFECMPPADFEARVQSADAEHVNRATRLARWQPQIFIPDRDKLWKSGRTIRVAFRGGDESLHKQIEVTAKEWSRHANITFQFRDKDDKFLKWSPGNFRFEADIRISFDYPKQPGYWSLVGADSVNPEVVAPDEPSMNFQSFDRQLPSHWRSTVLHEFGHALGLEHEHQSPASKCVEEVRWDDDPGYVPTTQPQSGTYIEDGQNRFPGVRRYLSGPPNNWTDEQIDGALREITPSSNAKIGTFDPDSIMIYHFPEWMYKSRAKSPCYVPERENLSTQDQTEIAETYPKSPAR